MSKKRTSRKQPVPAREDKQTLAPVRAVLLRAVRELVRQARERTARAVNAALVLLYWQIGRRIRDDILKKKRADYGEQIVPTLSAQLVAEFG